MRNARAPLRASQQHHPSATGKQYTQQSPLLRRPQVQWRGRVSAKTRCSAPGRTWRRLRSRERGPRQTRRNQLTHSQASPPRQTQLAGHADRVEHGQRDACAALWTTQLEASGTLYCRIQEGLITQAQVKDSELLMRMQPVTSWGPLRPYS